MTDLTDYHPRNIEALIRSPNIINKWISKIPDYLGNLYIFIVHFPGLEAYVHVDSYLKKLYNHL